jgi:hypothetical protein
LHICDWDDQVDAPAINTDHTQSIVAAHGREIIFEVRAILRIEITTSSTATNTFAKVAIFTLFYSIINIAITKPKGESGAKHRAFKEDDKLGRLQSALHPRSYQFICILWTLIMRTMSRFMLSVLSMMD